MEYFYNVTNLHYDYYPHLCAVVDPPTSNYHLGNECANGISYFVTRYCLDSTCFLIVSNQEGEGFVAMQDTVDKRF